MIGSPTIIIVDDEEPARDRLRQMLDDVAGWSVIGEGSNGVEALALCERLSPSVLLLDIRMPGMDGLETARHLATFDDAPAVIFTTAYDDYAIEAFDAQAVGYLLKPVRSERLLRALERAARLTQPQLQALTEDPERPAVRTTICVRKASALKLIPVPDILFFQADQKYLTVRHLHGEDLIDESLKNLAVEFGDRFIRVHRNALVATDHLDRMTRNATGQYEVWLKHYDQPLPVSRRHVTRVKNSLLRLT
jgi:two-component system response regulator AlgR